MVGRAGVREEGVVGRLRGEGGGIICVQRECHSVIIMSLTLKSPRISLRHPSSLHGCNWSELLTSSFSFVRKLQ